MEHIKQALCELIDERDRLTMELRELRKLWRIQSSTLNMDELLLPEKCAIVLRFLISGHEWLVEGRRVVILQAAPVGFPKGNTASVYHLGVVSEVLRYTGDEPETQVQVLRYRLEVEQFLTLVQNVTSGDINRMVEIMERESGKGGE